MKDSAIFGNTVVSGTGGGIFIRAGQFFTATNSKSDRSHVVL